MKSLRNSFRYRKKNRETGRLNTYYSKRLRYYQAGEYGKPTQENDFIARPHYHAIIFGHDFKDKKFFQEKEGCILYTSDSLDNIWGNGYGSVGEVNFSTAAYVARYIMKKTNASNESPDSYWQKYHRIDTATGEFTELQPEYATMSRGGTNGGLGGIGQGWYKKFKGDAYPSDYITINGVQQKPPKYYDRLHDLDPMGNMDKIREKRIAKINIAEQTPERLRARETVKTAQIQLLERCLK